ncbi:hypothetical protein CHH28_01590 [Bacterioplanes sanyensis]|uniref:CWH43-like N-terminal domain-containing protein n=1 Tax=Bacterioplanes sanyensis TaxID=1249553 RepID=A0A222FFB2_9GAMM|nr:hypothetical protein [Bacterioplanes sanyensis]ASP37450.1 hypothetical protein CHH28_01590 [Bacterioplanes sanyensis]
MLLFKATLPQRIALMAFLIPVVTIAVSYALTVMAGHEPLCIPYIEGCATITSTGIYYPAAYILRAGIAMSAVVFILWWYCVRAWLESVKQAPLVGWFHAVVWIAVIASVLIIASMVILGENLIPSRDHRTLWRFHAVTAGLFFLANSICQIMMTVRMRQLRDQLGIKFSHIIAKEVLAAIQLVMLLVLIVMTIMDWEFDGMIAFFEWWLATLSSLFYLSAYWDWHTFRLTRLEQEFPA